MVLQVLTTTVQSILPSNYYIHTFIAILTIGIIRAFAQGKKTNRERDLHARVVLVTGGFTSIGLTLLHELATRGAHIIALTADPIESKAPSKASILIDLLRTTTNNEQIFADQCDLTDPNSIHNFCTKFVMQKEKRLDAVIFAHEYQHRGSWFSPQSLEILEQQRKEASLATFLATTLLLPALLVAPAERDIRIINVINPFYAASAPSFTPSLSLLSTPTLAPKSIFLLEGHRALLTAVFTRHLQRVLDALPSSGQVPKTDDPSGSTVPIVSAKAQKSNIVAVSVCPGISRTDVIAPMLGVGRSWMGAFLFVYSLFILPRMLLTPTPSYIILQPVLRILTKTPTSALQSILHALFLPTPFKAAPKSKTKDDERPIIEDTTPEEILKPGALYRECAIVRLHVPAPPEPPTSDKEEIGNQDEIPIPIPDDGELGGEYCGRLVWESFEESLKEWERANPPPPEAPKKEEEGARAGTPPDVDFSSLTPGASS